MRPQADRAGLYGGVVSGAAGIPVITAQETGAAPPGSEEAGGAEGIIVEYLQWARPLSASLRA